MADEPQRLSKAVAAQVPCSRREAEQLIHDGWVRVDGEKVLEPQHRVTASQRIEIDSQARLQKSAPVTLLLHKPAGMGAEEAAALLPDHGIRFRQVMPLPPPASGLCVFSQDPGVLRKLTEDAALVEQELVAEVKGTLGPDGLARLGRSLPARVSWQNETRLRCAGKGMKLETLPALFAQAGLELVALRRIRIGRIPMAGLAVERWRQLPPGERF
jgi:23S rRNA pseudouridine2604 synthase